MLLVGVLRNLITSLQHRMFILAVYPQGRLSMFLFQKFREPANCQQLNSNSNKCRFLNHCPCQSRCCSVQENPRFTVSSCGAQRQLRLRHPASWPLHLCLRVVHRASFQARLLSLVELHRLCRPHQALLAVVAEEVGFLSLEAQADHSLLAEASVVPSCLVEMRSTTRTRSVAVVDHSARDLQVHQAHRAPALLARLAQQDLQVLQEVAAVSQARTSAGCRLRRGHLRHLALLVTSPSRSGCGASAVGRG